MTELMALVGLRIQNEKIETENIQNEENETDDIQDEKDSTQDERNENVTTDVRKSQKIRKQRMVIDPDQIGDSGNLQDLDCK